MTSTTLQPIKAVLFDLDDTLWPIMPVIVCAEAILYDWLGTHAPAVARAFTIATLRERRMAMLAAEPRYAIDLQKLRQAALADAFNHCSEDASKIEQAMTVFNRARNQVEPFDDVLPVLARLKSRVALGSVSNGAADLDAIGLGHHFRISIAAHQFGSGKPDPAIFHAACDALDVKPAEAVYVGDDPVLDVQGAQQAGLAGIWINRSALQPQRILPDHVRPDAICTTLYELEQWLTGRIMEH